MADVKIYRTSYCPYCDMAERLFKSIDQEVEKIDVTNDPDKRTWLVQETGQRTVPQIFIDDRHVGGYDDLAALERKGKLDALLT